MATAYFVGANSTEWTDLANWVDGPDPGTSNPLASLPLSTDSVVVQYCSIESNTGPTPTVASLLVINSSVDISITVTGTASIVNNSIINSPATIYGNASFQSSDLWGTVTGNASFESGNNWGTVTGNASFENAVNWGTVLGSASFDNSSNYGTTEGAAFVNFSTNEGGVAGFATFNTSSINYSSVYGDVLFTNSSYNSNGSVAGVATFDISSAIVMIGFGYDGSYNDVKFYGFGINGSSILGIM